MMHNYNMYSVINHVVNLYGLMAISIHLIKLSLNVKKNIVHKMTNKKVNNLQLNIDEKSV